MNTITVQDGSAASTSPDLILGYETTRTSRNLVHDTLDGAIAVSIYPTRPRAGTLELFYRDEAAATAALQLHARDATFALTSDERDISMLFIVVGEVGFALDEDTRDHWVVAVGYQEIIP